MQTGKKKELNRLRRIEGQIRAVARMLEQGKDDSSIDTQLRAIQSAIYALRIARFEHRILLDCEREHIDRDVCEKIREKLRSFLK